MQWRNVLRGSVGVRSNLEAGGLRAERLVGSHSGPDNSLIGRVIQTLGRSSALSVLGSALSLICIGLDLAIRSDLFAVLGLVTLVRDSSIGSESQDGNDGSGSDLHFE